MIDFHGAFTALVTPFTEDGASVDLRRLEENIRGQAAAGITGIVPCGTTGETPTLSEAEQRTVIERSIAAAGPGLSVIVGAGSNDTRHAVENHRFTAAAGADAALHVTPYYNKPSQEGLYRHFMTIADSCDLPVVLYNIPGRTCVLLERETITRLAAHPNVAAVKDATGRLDIASEIAASTDLAVLSGDDPLTLPLASVGAVGVVSVLSNLLPERVAALCRAFLGGDWDEARRIHRAVLPLAQALLTLDTNPVPLKAALRILGRDTGAVRLPLCSPGEHVIEKLRSLLEELEIGEIGDAYHFRHAGAR